MFVLSLLGLRTADFALAWRCTTSVLPLARGEHRQLLSLNLLEALDGDTDGRYPDYSNWYIPGRLVKARHTAMYASTEQDNAVDPKVSQRAKIRKLIEAG